MPNTPNTDTCWTFVVITTEIIVILLMTQNLVGWNRGLTNNYINHNDSASLPPSGGCRWIRTPAIMYATHVATTLLPILSHILFSKFPGKPPAGPQTSEDRWVLVCIYVPYLLVPLLLLVTMLFSSTYNSGSRNTTSKKKKKK